ncbi:MAG: hypothetical protein QMB90_10485 [Rubritalea sp.]
MSHSDGRVCLTVPETVGIDRRAIHEQRESENPAPSTKQKPPITDHS